ncbi:MAG: site-2 protease family protein [Pirellulales bacterium]
MRDVLYWSLGLRRFGGMPVRLHIFFLVTAAFILYVAAGFDRGRLLWYAASMLGVLLASVAIHEWGHFLAAQRVGGHVPSVVLWPFGSMTHAVAPPDPVAEAAVALAGPAMNLAVCGVTAIVLQWQDRGILPLMNPLSVPYTLALEEAGLPWQAGLEMTFWINWLLALVNMVPASPLDGARALRAGLTFVAGPKLGSYLTVRCGQFAALGMLFAAWWLHTGEYRPAVMPLVLLGCFLFFSAQGESWPRAEPALGDDWPHAEDLSGYDLDDTLEMTGPRRPGPLRQWIETCKEQRRQKRQALEAEEERRVDAILARVHETGIDALSPQEHSLLQRVSARYRSRQGNS